MKSKFLLSFVFILTTLAISTSAYAVDVTLSWRDNSDNETNWIIERNSGSGWVEIANRPTANGPGFNRTASYVDKVVPLNARHCWRVWTINTQGTLVIKSANPSNEACISLLVPKDASGLIVVVIQNGEVPIEEGASTTALRPVRKPVTKRR